MQRATKAVVNLMLTFTISVSYALNPLAQVEERKQAFAPRASSKQQRAPRRTTTTRRDLQLKLRRPDVIYVPTPPETVTEMLRLANIKKGDVLYDLGSGDGRILVAAARDYGIRAVGIDIDPKMIEAAAENARQAGVEGLVSFRYADLFRANISEATIVTLYLSDSLNLLLRPKLWRELRPGTRIISHDFRMGDWPPEQTIRVPWKNLHRTVYVWRVPTNRSRK